ncbi:MAG: hypothetical protein DI539_14805 [Flavobacterium psychrophilum]|nr:MAG: hypothetical protein DI539_14805 [Flavobacterium psychrophilum]
MTSSYIIKELRLSGLEVEPAIITFEKGLNIIAGPTGTGKSYIYQCINYMLGSSKKPKAITQAEAYRTLELTILSYEGIQYVLTSDLKGGAIFVSSRMVEGKRKLSRKHKAGDTETISGFLLELNNLYGRKIRKNAKGKTRDISFRDVARFMMVDENSIITDGSPILSGQHTSATEEKSTFKLLITGRDDSDVIEELSKDEVKYRNGKIHLLTELIYTETKELHTFSENAEAQLMIQRIDGAIVDANARHADLKNNFFELDSNRNGIAKKISELRGNVIYNEELLKRSSILKSQYLIDSERLNSTIEASYLLGTTEESGPCPVCSKPMDCKEHDENVSLVIAACNSEIQKIQKLLDEVSKADAIILEENMVINVEIEKLEESLGDVTDLLENGVVKEMEELFAKISELNSAKINLLKVVFIKEKIDSLQQQKNVLANSLTKQGEGNFGGLLTSQVEVLSGILKNVLEGFNFEDVTHVTFSESKNDFVISGEDRELAGKGIRAITYASFLIALQELLYDKEYSIGPCIMDSPLVTYRKPKAENEGITIDLAMDFYRYVADNTKIMQTIILENEEPPSDVLDKINLITFTKQTSNGRYGFIPVNQ